MQLWSSSFHIEFHELYWSIIKLDRSKITDSDLNVISQCWGGGGRVTLNRGGELKVQQKLVGPDVTKKVRKVSKF